MADNLTQLGMEMNQRSVRERFENILKDGV